MSFALMLVISTVAFAFMIGSETGMVNGAVPTGINRAYIESQTWTTSTGQPQTLAFVSHAPTPDELSSLKFGESYWHNNNYYTKGTDGLFVKTTAIQLDTFYGTPEGTTQSAFGYYANVGNVGRTITTTDEGETKVVTATPTPTDAPNNVAVTGIAINGQKLADAKSTYLIKGDEIYTVQLSDGKTLDLDKNTDYTITSSPGKEGTTYYLNGDKKLNTEDYNALMGKSQLSVISKGAPSDVVAYSGTEYSDGKFISPSTGGVYNDAAERIGTDRGQIKVLGTSFDFGVAQLLQGVQWAATAAGLVVTLGSLFSDDPEAVNAAAAGMAGGIMVGKALYSVLGRGGENYLGLGRYASTNADGSLNMIGRNSGLVSGIVGAAAAWLIYNSMWSKTETKTHIVTFDCLPWQAPHGGEDCELCNDNTLPCSEYRCKSLGQSCAIVNKGTIAERCVDVNPRDVSPPVITPLKDAITEGYQYFDVREMPPGAGFKIKSSRTETGCIPPFTPIKFGITTDEPSQCKIDIEPRGNYSKMSSYLGGDNLYSYNHTEYLTLPSAKDFKNSSVTLKNGKELTFYMRCQDASGNSNEADYALTLCVDPSPDTTAPVIQGTSINNNGCVAATTENATVDFYINEPAQCRWSFTESSYDQMTNNMLCANTPVDINALQSYTCRTTLNGIARDGTKFYVRCKDQPTNVVNDSARNVNRESYIFNLRGSSELKLKALRPNETIFGVLNPSPIELYVETLFGCDNNKAICYYSTSDSAGSFVQFFDTNKADGVHTQRLDLTQGRYTYFVKCVDAGGNLVQNSTSFTVNIDTNSPIIARAYQEDNYLKIITHLNSECTYTSDNCDYLFEEGIVMPYPNSTSHVTEWSPSKKYYIKCRDEFRTEPADCSLVVGPTENFL